MELPFKLGAFVDGEFVPTRFSWTLTFDLGIVLYATNIPGAALPLPTVAPLLAENGGSYIHFTIYPDPYPGPNVGASLLGGVTSLASVPGPSALWCFALNAVCILARRFWRTPTRCATFRPSPP